MSESEVVENPQTSSLSSQRSERMRRIKLSIFTAVLTRPLAVVISLVTIPLFLNYFDDEHYGLYAIAVALGAWFHLTNLGLGLGLMNKLTDCHVAEDRATAVRAVSTMMVTVSGIALGGMIIWSAASFWIPWHLVFRNVSPQTMSELPWVFWLAGLLTLVGVVIRVPTPIYSAYQELHRNNLWDGLSKLATLGACIGVVFTPFGLIGVVLAVLGTPVLIRSINVMVLFGYEKRWLLPRPSLFDPALFKPLIVQSLGLFVLQMAVVALFQADKLIIGIVIGLVHVTPYEVLGKLFLTLYGVYRLVLAPLWPAHGEAIRRGDLGWTRKIMRLSLLLGCGLPLAFGLIMVVWGPEIIDLWTRGQALEFSVPLIVAFTSMFALRAWSDGHSILLNTMGVIKPQAIFLVTQAVLNIILAITLAHWFGVVGVAWSASITALLTTAWGYPWMIRRYLFNRAEQGTTDLIIAPIEPDQVEKRDRMTTLPPPPQDRGR